MIYLRLKVILGIKSQGGNMFNLDMIREYIMTYSGTKYKRPVDNSDLMWEVMKQGKSARDEFVKLGKEVLAQLPGFTMYKCTNWINMAQVVPDYFWIQFKRQEFEKCPSSITLAAKKVKDKFYIYIAIEIKDADATKEDFKVHNELINISINNNAFYFSGDNQEYFNLKQNNEYGKKLLENRTINKIRLQKNIDLSLDNTRVENILYEITQGIQFLMPYYNKIIHCFKQNTNNIRKDKEEINKIMNSKDEWVIICNPRFYDVMGAFKEFSCIDWKQSTNIKQGDVVYIYIGLPYKEIRYKCIAREVELKKTTIDDTEFILDGSNYENYERYMKLELVSEYNEGQYPYSELKTNGLKSVQGPSRVSEELAEYIKTVEIKTLSHSVQQDNYQDDELVCELNTVLLEGVVNDFEYQGYPRKKKSLIIKNGLKVYIRDKNIAMNALAHAKYLCEINPEHPSFVRKSMGINYTEPHHLIPMAYSSLFDVSLDVEENIISLCSNCHNQIHYGVEIEHILKKLYHERIEYLKRVGINISYKQLLEMYNTN